MSKPSSFLSPFFGIGSISLDSPRFIGIQLHGQALIGLSVLPLLVLDYVVVMVDDQGSRLFTSYGLFKEFCVVLVGDFVCHHLPHVLINVCKRIHYHHEGLSCVFKDRYVCIGDAILADLHIFENVIMIDHLTSLQVSICGLIVNDSTHDEEDEFRSVAYLRNDIVLCEPLGSELLEILIVEVIVSILKEFIHKNGILVQELG